MTNVNSHATEAVQKFLADNQGEQFTITVMSSRLDVGPGSVTAACNDLERRGVVRRGAGDKVARFYMPTKEQLAIMSAQRQMSMSVLKPRQDHLAVIERIRAERLAIPSLMMMEAV